jgi:pimeloyl-ACP methyl ester carboxylesterase
LAVHGTGSNFYSGHLFDNLSPKLVAARLPVLRVNTRGNDVISTAATMEGPRRVGSSLERVDDCRHDVLAWLEFLAQRGFAKIAVVGHSLGAIKVIHTLAHTHHPAAARLVAISPPRLSYSHFLS